MVRRSPLRRLNSRATAGRMLRRLREGIYITNRQGTILDANPAFLEMLGVSSLKELSALPATELVVSPDQRERELEILEREGSVRDYELVIRRPDGEVRTLLDTAYSVEDPATGEVLFHGILIDITRYKELQEELRRQALRDPLTGLYNRRWLAGLAEEIDATEERWATIVIDIDHFKRYNDTHGHHEGDRILVAMGRFLSRVVRAEDAVVRIGGDEFLVVMRHGGEEGAQEILERLRGSGPTQAPVPFTMGISARRGKERLEKTIGRADTELIQIRLVERQHEPQRREAPS